MAAMRKTLGDYLSEVDPVALLWIDMMEIVYRGNPAEACLERLGASARLLFHVGSFEAEVINGGLRHFLSTPAANLLPEVVAALREIGAPISVDLLDQALRVFPGGVAPADRRQRCELLFALHEDAQRQLAQLTNAFFSRVDTVAGASEEDLSALQLAYMDGHRGEPLRADERP